MTILSFYFFFKFVVEKKWKVHVKEEGKHHNPIFVLMCVVNLSILVNLVLYIHF